VQTITERNLGTEQDATEAGSAFKAGIKKIVMLSRRPSDERDQSKQASCCLIFVWSIHFQYRKPVDS
jgi:hypothetical protein